jgi:hypothetical protein
MLKGTANSNAEAHLQETLWPCAQDFVQVGNSTSPDPVGRTAGSETLLLSHVKGPSRHRRMREYQTKLGFFLLETISRRIPLQGGSTSRCRVCLS